MAKKIMCMFMVTMTILYMLPIGIYATEAQTNYAEKGKSAFEEAKVADVLQKIVEVPNCKGIQNTINVTLEMVKQAGISVSYKDTYTYGGTEYNVYTAAISEFEADRTKYVFFNNNSLVIDDALLAELAKFVYTLEWKNMSTGTMIYEAIPAMQEDEWRYETIQALEGWTEFLSGLAGNLTAYVATGGATGGKIVQFLIEYSRDEIFETALDIESSIISAVTLGYFNGTNDLMNLRTDFISLATNTEYLSTEDGVQEFYYDADYLHKVYSGYAAMIDYVAELNKRGAWEVISDVGSSYCNGLVSAFSSHIFANINIDKASLIQIYSSEKCMNRLLNAEALFNGASIIELLTGMAGNWNDVSPALAAAESAMASSTNTAYDAINALCGYTRNYVYNTAKEHVQKRGYWEGHEYAIYMIPEITSWEMARLFCEEIGGHLATILSKEEDVYLHAYMNECGYASAYFGFTAGTTEDSWMWVDGSVSNYTNWASGEPNNQGEREQYGMYYWKYGDGTWNDGDFGGVTEAFICEWDDVKKGDLDGDGELTIKDAFLVINAALTETPWAKGDMNEDGRISVADVLCTMKSAVAE